MDRNAAGQSLYSRKSRNEDLGLWEIALTRSQTQVPQARAFRKPTSAFPRPPPSRAPRKPCPICSYRCHIGTQIASGQDTPGRQRTDQNVKKRKMNANKRPINWTRVPELSDTEVSEIATRHLGQLDWDGTEFACRCPGAALHSKREKDSRNTARFGRNARTNWAWALNCWHSESCAAAREAAIKAIRSDISKARLAKVPPKDRRRAFSIDPAGRGLDVASAQDSKVQMERRNNEHREKATVRALAKSCQLHLIERNPWPLEQIFKMSPRRLFDNPIADTMAWLSLYSPDDVLWVGQKWDSGDRCRSKGCPLCAQKWLPAEQVPGESDEHYGARRQRRMRNAMHWRSAWEWAEYFAYGHTVEGEFTASCTFKPGSYRRCKETTMLRPYLAVEGDNPLGLPDTKSPEAIWRNRNATSALVRWLSDSLEIGNPTMAVYSGRRSDHWWWPWPIDPEGRPFAQSEFAAICKRLGLDPHISQDSQPCRRPGALRPDTGRIQKIIYFDPSRNALNSGNQHGEHGALQIVFE